MNKRYIIAIVAALLGIYSLTSDASLFNLICGVIGIAGAIITINIPSEWIEDGFGDISNRYKISSLVAGGVFMAIASSSPEFFTSLSGVVVHGVFEIGFLTMCWSALFNICIIIGVCSFYRPYLKMEPQLLKRDLPFYGLTLILLVIFALDGAYRWYDFASLIALYFIYLGVLYFDKSAPYKKRTKDTLTFTVAKIVGGLSMVGVLSFFIVELGLSMVETTESVFYFIIPISVVSALVWAPGTSVTDLFVSIAATKKGEDSVAILNGVGSNTFDLTICLGVPGLMYVLKHDQPIMIDLQGSIMTLSFVATSLVLLYGFGLTGLKVRRWQGVLMIALFVVSLSIFVYTEFANATPIQ